MNTHDDDKGQFGQDARKFLRTNDVAGAKKVAQYDTGEKRDEFTGNPSPFGNKVTTTSKGGVGGYVKSEGIPAATQPIAKKIGRQVLKQAKNLSKGLSKDADPDLITAADVADAVRHPDGSAGRTEIARKGQVVVQHDESDSTPQERAQRKLSSSQKLPKAGQAHNERVMTRVMQRTGEPTGAAGIHKATSALGHRMQQAGTSSPAGKTSPAIRKKASSTIKSSLSEEDAGYSHGGYGESKTS